MKIIKYIIFLVSLNFILSSNISTYRPGQVANAIQLTGEDYISGEDGVARMNINIWGHVKYPGAYLVYDGIDLLTCLSMAGGPLKGANLSSVTILSKDGSIKKINLDKKINYNSLLRPHDTLCIDETLGNYLLARSNIINTLLQITNLILISK